MKRFERAEMVCDPLNIELGALVMASDSVTPQ